MVTKGTFRWHNKTYDTFNGTVRISDGRVHVVATNGQRLASCYLEVGDHTERDGLLFHAKRLLR